jgi:hypothetical protein
VKNNLQKSIVEMNKNNDILTIKQQLRTRTSIINLSALNNNINTDKCTKDEFKLLIHSLKFPEKYYRDILIDTLFNSYLNEDGETMNMTKLCKDCLSIKDDNNFSQFKDRVFENYENKIVDQLKQVDDTVVDLQKEKESRLNLVQDLGKQIVEREEIKKKLQEIEEKNLKEVINPQPSTAFINKVFKDHRKMYEILNKAEESFMPKHNITLLSQYKTRFNGNPPHKDTFYMINQDPKGSSYINEKERFDVSTNLADFIRKEKEQKRLKDLARLNSIRKFENMREDACKTMEKIFEQKDIACQNKKTVRMYDYELLNRIRNEFVE